MTAKITVGICTYNRVEMLRRTVDSIMLQKPAGVSYEVVIVDDGSCDGTGDFLLSLAREGEPPVRVFCEQRVGVAAARNRVIAESRGDWIAFVDDDEVVAPDYLEQLYTVAVAEHADVAAGTIRLLRPDGSEVSLTGTCRKYLSEVPAPGRFKKKYVYPGPGTGFCLIRKRLFDEIGVFDPALSVVGEDQDFFRRAARAGAVLVQAPKALVHHLVPEERLHPDYLLRQARMSGKSLAYFDCKDWGWRKTVYVCGLRVGHALAATVPRLAISYLKRDANGITSGKCSLSTAASYVAETFSLLTSQENRSRADR